MRRERDSWKSPLRVGVVVVFWALVLQVQPGSATGEDERRLWAAIRSPEHFVMMRHALAPGTGDPPSFVLGDCGTQRNLSGEGRRQAGAIGERLRSHGIEEARIYSSQWCRCLETAELLELGEVRELPALNSFFGRYELKDQRMRDLRGWLAGQELNRPLILVTHQVTITAMTGVFPSSGEMVVVRRDGDGRFTVVGSVAAGE